MKSVFLGILYQKESGGKMNKKFMLICSYIMVAALATCITLRLTMGQETLSKLDQLESLIEDRFIGEADPEALEDAAAGAMVSATGDRWSYYIPASEYETYMEQMTNAYVGVGITIQAQEDDSGFLILSVTAGGPAEEAGLRVNDLIIRVEDQDVRGMDTEAFRDLVRGEQGTSVTLTALRSGVPVTVSVERRKVETAVAAYEMLEGKTGLVTIKNFDERCAEETIDAIEALLDQGAEKLILDVRNNPGGYADELVKVLDYLLPEGEVFHTVDYNGKEKIDYSDASCLELPMAVLVNGSSYSAAEFFAAALQENEAAIVVGEKTVGKGYFQTTFHLNDGSAVALSVGKYYTPKGENLAGVGITPDKVVTVDEKMAAAIRYNTLTPEEDPQIQAALKALK